METKIFEYDGIKMNLLAVAPPHLIFLMGKAKLDTELPNDVMLKRSGGLAALLVASAEGMTWDAPAKLPRRIEQLEELGEDFIMSAFELFGDYAKIADFIGAIMGSYSEKNPT